MPGPVGSVPPPGEVLHVNPERPDDVPFLIAREAGRFGGAFGVSLATHVAGAALLVFLITYAPNALDIATDTVAPDLSAYNIVWIPQEGPGGGGGGGGNRSPEPPRKIELPGKDKISLPVAQPVNLETPKETKKEPPPIEQLSIPALAMASGLQTLPGTLDGVGVTNSQGPGSGGGAGTGRGTGIGPGEGSGLGPGSGGGTGGGVYRPGSGVTTPRPIREVKPQYTAEAMRAKIQGEVWLEAVVLPDGSVGRVEIVRSLDSVFGLDQEAVKAAKLWRFVPGARMGQPVPVLVVISMTFTLR